MLLIEISSSVESISTRFAAAKEQLTAAKKAAGAIHQGMSQVHKDRISKSQSLVTAIQQELTAAYKRTEVEKQQRDANHDFASKREAETSEHKKDRLAQAHTLGHDAGIGLRNTHGGWQGLANAVHKYVKTASNDGVDKVTAEDISSHFDGVTVRTINKWLERPEFTKTAQLLGRR